MELVVGIKPNVDRSSTSAGYSSDSSGDNEMTIPLELLSMGASAVLSGVMTIWAKSSKDKAQQHSALIERSSLQGEIFTKAREYKGNRGFQFTRRVIALSIVFSIVILPKLTALLGIDTTVGWTEIQSGFWFWSSDETKVVWHTAKGMVLTPLDTHLASAVVGMYFGNSVVKNA